MSVYGKKLSLSTGSLDRLDHLKQALATWVIRPEPDEILIVDWGNKQPLRDALREFDDPRLVFARVKDQPHWLNAKCHNLELQLITGEWLLRLDSDCLLEGNFFSLHYPGDNVFYAGNWKKAPFDNDTRTRNKCGLTGTLFVKVADALKVNGYNERLVTYGAEDDDLYDRLARSGLRRIDIDFATLDHIPHPTQKRYEHLKVAGELQTMISAENTKGDIDEIRRCHLIGKSHALARSKPWTLNDKMTTWATERLSSQCVECEEIIAYRSTMEQDVAWKSPEDFLPVEGYVPPATESKIIVGSAIPTRPSLPRATPKLPSRPSIALAPNQVTSLVYHHAHSALGPLRNTNYR